ncbi:hypothetical protein ACIU1J_07375 [Azospirillum doebereinerae]|uniref:hypothetical protein n=1 Tax=Azospirillum doebereinerae TaxID=92933 RepID=UPI003850E5E2
MTMARPNWRAVKGKHRLQHGPVAQVDVPVVGTADDETVERHGGSRRWLWEGDVE